MTTSSVRLLRPVCYISSAAALGGAGSYLLFGSNKGLGILLVLTAAILCRILILEIAEREPAGRSSEDEQSE